MKPHRILSDIKLGIHLFQREGFKAFFSRMCWYFRGVNLREDIFKRKSKKLLADWSINMENPIFSESQSPKVSVVIPLHNHENYIEEAIKSVQSQTYPKIELIVIDDGSSDKSYERALKTLKSGKRAFQCIKQKNKGAHVTINRGIEMSTGKYIAILNSDDFYHPDRFLFLISALENSDSEMAFSGVDLVNEYSEKVEDTVFSKRIDYSMQFPTVGFSLLYANIAISSGNFVFTKRLYEEVGRFDSWKLCHDWAFILSTLRIAEPLFLSNHLYSYRFHAENTFLSLQKKLVDEPRKILLPYLNGSITKSIINKKFPSQKNWPKYFPKFIRLCGYQKWIK